MHRVSGGNTVLGTENFLLQEQHNQVNSGYNQTLTERHCRHCLELF